MNVVPRHLAPFFIVLSMLLCSGALSGCSHTGTHALADDWIPVVAHPEFPSGQGPVVLVDAAHGNWHTIDGRFHTFAELLKKDGYRVRSSDGKITSELLAQADVFVISNAVKGGEESVWVLPTPPALAPEESRALIDWVGKGGSLLLIADHMPFPGSVAQLADAFGIIFFNGYAKKSAAESGTLVFARVSGSLADHPISRGRRESERVASVKTFTGQAFRSVTSSMQPLMLMPDDWDVFLPLNASKIGMDTPKVSARGLVQGAVLRFGYGRLAVFGEAAMFSAQAQAKGKVVVRFGMNDPEAAHNAQFVLNVMHWLSGLLD